jgi:hypothetical protein
LNTPFQHCLFEHDFSIDLCSLPKDLIRKIFYHLNQENVLNVGYISKKEAEKTIPNIKIVVHLNESNQILMLNDFVNDFVQVAEMIKN